jgi:hypothetical protein
VGDVEGGDGEALVQATDLEAHLLAQARVEVGERLVEQQDLGLHHEGPRHRHPLLLAPRELARIARAVAGELHHLEHLLDLALAVAARDPREPQAVGHVLRHRHVRPERVALEDHRHAPPLGRDHERRGGEHAVADADLAAVGREEAGDQAQRGGLAAAGGPEERDQLARAHRQVEAGHRGHVAEALGEAADRDPGHAASSIRSTAARP